MLVLNSKQVIPCYIQLRQDDNYLLGFTYLNQSFIKSESYRENQEKEALRRTRELLDKGYCCVVLRHGKSCSLWCPVPEEATVIKKTNPNTQNSPKELSEEFINHCQQVLATYIGPMAKWVNEEALENLSSPITRERYVQALAAEIPDAKQTKEFIEKVTPS